MFKHGFSDDTPIDVIILKYIGIDIKGKPLKKVLAAMAAKYDWTYGNLQPTYAQFTSYALSVRYSYLVKRVIALYDLEEVETKNVKNFFWELTAALNTVRRSEKPWPDYEIKKKGAKKLQVPKKEIIIISKDKSIDTISEVTLYKYEDDKVDIDCVAYFEKEHLTVEFSKIGASYEDEHYIIVKNTSLLTLFEKLEIEKENKSALLTKLSTIFNEKDCFEKVEAFLNLNSISFEYLVRHG